MVLWIAMAVAMAGIGMVSPLLPVYVREELHGPELAVALSFSGLAVTQLAMSPLVGRLGDRHGPKILIVVGFLIYGAAGLGYLFSHHWALVIAFRLLSGVGAAAIFPMALSYVGRLAPPGREGTYMGMYAVAETAGFGLGPLLGGAVRDLVSSQAAFLTMSVALCGTGLLALIALPAVRGSGHRHEDDEEEEPGSVARPWREVARMPIVQAAVAARVCVSTSWGAGSTFLAVYVVSSDGLNTGSATFVGIVLAARSLLGGLVQPLTGRLADRLNRRYLVASGLGIAAVCLFVIPDLPKTLVEASILGDQMTTAPWLLLVFVVMGMAEAFAMPAQQALFVEAGRQGGMGAVMSLNQMASSLGFLSGSLLGAAVVSAFGLPSVFRFAGLLVFAGVVAFWVLMRRAQMRPARLVIRELAPATAGDD
ncbi:MAG: MFS transporter [Dehalococcoidia bacterium]|nr:MFS transporter [Dehalococcoidia bacterium]